MTHILIFYPFLNVKLFIVADQKGFRLFKFSKVHPGSE